MNHKTPTHYSFLRIKHILKCTANENNKSIQTIGKITIPERKLQSVNDRHIISLDFTNCSKIPSEEIPVHIYGHLNSINSSVNYIEVIIWKELSSEEESKIRENLLSEVQYLCGYTELNFANDVICPCPSLE